MEVDDDAVGSSAPRGSGPPTQMGTTQPRGGPVTDPVTGPPFGHVARRPAHTGARRVGRKTPQPCPPTPHRTARRDSPPPRPLPEPPARTRPPARPSCGPAPGAAPAPGAR